MHFKSVSLLLVALFLFGCNQRPEENNGIQEHIDAIKSKVAPDKRVALFAIEALKNNDTFILKGESNLPDGIKALTGILSENNIPFVDSIALLPSKELGDSTRAVINISVANLRSNPKHSAELATQATLGTPVKVLKKQGDWYYIQTPDNYLSWVDKGGIQLMGTERFAQWKAMDKVVYTKTYGHSYNAVDEKELVSDLVAGNILEFVKLMDGYFVASYPDGRIALIRVDEAESYFGWVKDRVPEPGKLVATSKTLMGVPYLWGGTSTKGMDCSGFTKTVYFLNGMVIPRDASQQVYAGKPIDSVQDFSRLERGDLLFFGRKATDTTTEKVVHVGMWIGNNEFIHASDMVRISSMDPEADNFDAYNKDRYLRTKRLLKEEDDALVRLARTPLFKD
ncbi:C40 family peptidase [Maribacter sp. R77961]|uniref:C40 family peptidase n=1 Tax=Maribacter sp. R77961 TaxID=3093871 RepID=UPI0037C68AF8